MINAVTELMTSRAWQQCECDTHKVILVRGPTGWVCPVGPTCTGLISDELLLQRISVQLGRRETLSEALSKKERNAILREVNRASAAFHSKETHSPKQ